MELEEALRRVYPGRSIAFMGAGFSAGVDAIEGQIPYGFEFAAELASAAKEPTDLPLDLASSVYQGLAAYQLSGISFLSDSPQNYRRRPIQLSHRFLGAASTQPTTTT